MTHSKTSPFLHPTTTAQPNKLAILHLRRDQQLPVVLLEHDEGEDGNRNPNTTSGYAEGVVTNTRFGSYPHSTLLHRPWGSQVVASSVNTGNRGKTAKKRKLDDDESQPRAASGFCHILPPTPESWTTTLPHRTQIVYTPDYSFVLQRLRARPGCVLIEAGAGSGSFTHAATRAVFNGYPPQNKAPSTHNYGRVFSFEYHEPRAQQLVKEIEEHGLDSIVTVTHRDVYHDGFLLPSSTVQASTTPSYPTETSETLSGTAKDDIDQERHNAEPTNGHIVPTLTRSPRATQIFLDLPAPWNALPHLKRGPSSPLDPDNAVHICCFLPCIEQVQRCITSLKQHDWVEISMHQLTHRRIEVRREKVGLEWEGLRGVNATPATVEESMARLKQVREREKEYRAEMIANSKADADGDEDDKQKIEAATTEPQHRETKAQRLERVKREASSRKVYMEGYLATRTEPDMKSHTSYLVFGTLPMEWHD